MLNLIEKLENFAPLDAADRDLLRLTGKPIKVQAKTDLVREGDAADCVYLVLEGFAYRYKLTAEGGRQITAYLIPGDFCDLDVFVLHESDHSIAAVSPCTVVGISKAQMQRMLRSPTVAQALWWSTLADEAILREWIVNLGQRSAEKRIAHFLCELLLRLRGVRLADRDSYELPLTQTDLGDLMGLSTVHVNRSLQSLRESGLITFSNKRLKINDVAGLEEFSGFNSNYLHRQ